MVAVLRVLIVEDSAFMARAIKTILESSPDIKVVGVAKNGKEAVEMTLQLEPDLISMDIEMPVMNGIDATKEIMRLKPTPILVISTLTSEGAQITMDALGAGAVDFIAKRSAFDTNQIMSMRDEIVARTLEIGRNADIRNNMIRRNVIERQKDAQPLGTTNGKIEKTRVSPHTLPSTKNSTGTDIANKGSIKKRPPQSHFDICVIGVSTGGPLSLQKVIPLLPKEITVPVLIVQHMPPHFTKSLAERLDGASKITVKEAEHGDHLKAGTVYIAPGGMQMTVTKTKTIAISTEPASVLYKPSVEVLGESILDVYGGKALAIMMTGMGRDGADAYKKLNKAGAYVVAQNSDTCVVYGMPKAVVEEGSAHEVVALEDIASVMINCIGRQTANASGAYKTAGIGVKA